MKIIGIICEYNPFHTGHKKQLTHIKSTFGPDCGIVCLMSGNFVQRGEPAIGDKMMRAQAAMMSGADLVLELPVTCALSSAEGFAAGGVKILSGFCDGLSFGVESNDPEQLKRVAEALLEPEFPMHLRKALDSGCSFPVAREQALAAMGVDGSMLSKPNQILGIEYCKAVLQQNSKMELLPMLREGNYHDVTADRHNPSATAVRNLMLSGGDWRPYVPEEVHGLYQQMELHTLEAGTRGVLARVRTMSDGTFEALPYGSEGLWRKFMAACRRETGVEEILAAVKSKRYTRTRLNRMLMCAVLGLTATDMKRTPPYTRVLALNDTGRSILNKARLAGDFPNVGEKQDADYWELEQRCSDWYGLFACSGPEPGGQEPKRRIYYQK